MKNNKPKNPNHKCGCGHCSELIIDEPVIKLVQIDKPEKDKNQIIELNSNLLNFYQYFHLKKFYYF